MPDEPITVLIADDHTIVRQGLAKLLEDEPGIRVVGEAENGRQAVELAEKLSPRVVVMDIAMPLLNGIEATRRIKKARPGTLVIILSMHGHDRYIHELFTLGASGYLLKDSSGADIVKAIRAAVDGGTCLSPSISRRVVDEYVTMKRVSPREELYGSLSNREREVFQMIAEGHSVRRISDILCISASTVKTHRANIMEKLKLETTSQLIQFAIRLGVADIPA